MIGKTNAGGGGSTFSDELTAKAENVLKGKTAVTQDSDDEAIVGTMPDNTTTTSNGNVPKYSSSNNYPTREATDVMTIATDSNGVKRLNMCPPKGYYQGSNQSYVNRPASELGNTLPAYVLSGTRFTSGNSGINVAGEMANHGAVNQNLIAGASYTIPAGYHNGSGRVSADNLASQTSANANASLMVNGYTAWVNGSKITGNLIDRGNGNYTNEVVNEPSYGRIYVRLNGNGWYHEGSNSPLEYVGYNYLVNALGINPENIKAGTSIAGITGTLTDYSDPSAQLVFNYGTFQSSLQWGVSYDISDHDYYSTVYTFLDGNHIYSRSYNSSNNKVDTIIRSNRSFKFGMYNYVKVTFSSSLRSSYQDKVGFNVYLRGYDSNKQLIPNCMKSGQSSADVTGDLQECIIPIQYNQAVPLVDQQARFELRIGNNVETGFRETYVYKIELLK